MGVVSLVAPMAKDLSAMQETQVRSLDWKDPLEEEMATYSSILAWEILCTEEPGRLQSMELQSQTRLSMHVCTLNKIKLVEIWMDLESVIQNEINHKEKNKYCILTHICGI